MTLADSVGQAVGGRQTATPAGRVDVTERVFTKVVRAASAELIGIGRDALRAEVAGYRGGLAVRLATPLPVPPLDDPDAVRAMPGVIERSRALQEHLQERLSRLTGRDITRIDITVTGAVTPERRRVR
ncbi:hypothetical protein [Microbacterium sp. ABRD28]|uniref:hypothetical protein n=1 Tax=Microbacterium sp. ABRD28 TaxID=2268461 RepID=UPI000F557803|nr:hypothetical protein [Microbacterium sp. ABRD28]AZC12439.1 hypothetical protein DT073_00770 [Microbacterium sp. ABRD28]